MTKLHIEIDMDRIAQFCTENGIRKLAFFGSVLRDDFGPDSDVDVLVEFEEDRVPDFFGFVDMQDELSEICSGRKIDLLTDRSIRGERRKSEIFGTAEVFYERAA